MFRIIFSYGNKIFSKRFCRKWTYNYSFEGVTKEYINKIISAKEKGNVDTIKNDKIVKLPWVPKLGSKSRVKKRILKTWHKNHFYFRT